VTNRKTIPTNSFSDHKPGTSGLRKKVRVLQQAHYLENFMQSIFNSIASGDDTFSDKTLVVGGDGRFHSSEAAQSLIEALRQQINALAGQCFGNFEIELADDFSYTDPVDGSTSQPQGLRILLYGGSRIIYRLSGAGTEGATLRVYIASHETNPVRQSEDRQNTLGELINLACQLVKIKHYSGHSSPDVLT